MAVYIGNRRIISILTGGGPGVEGAQEEGEEGPPDKLRESFWKVNV